MLTFEKQLADWIRQTTVEWRDVLTDFMPREQLMAAPRWRALFDRRRL